MKKRLIVLAALAAGMAVACQKENLPAAPDPSAEEGLLLLTVEGYTDPSGAKTSVSGTSVHWVDGDAINFYNKPYGKLTKNTRQVTGSSVNFNTGNVEAYGIYPNTFDLSNHATGSSGLTYLPVQYTVKLPASYTSSYDAEGRQVIALPMLGYAAVGATRMEFKHLTAAVLVRVMNSTSLSLTLDRVQVVCDTWRLCEESGVVVRMEDGAPNIEAEAYSASASDTSKVTVTFDHTATVAPGEIIDVQVPIRPIDAADLRITVKGSAPAQQGTLVDEFSYTFSHKTSSVALGRNVMLTARIRLDPTSQYVASPGTFSVSPTKAVYFSQGNLQYQASTGTWRFADNQQDYIGNQPGNTTADGRRTQADWIDLLGWGTSGDGTHDEDNPWYVGGLASNYGPYGQFDLAGDHYRYDWGSRPIANGGNGAGLWRTLTEPEWSYLLGRANGSGVREGRSGSCRVGGGAFVGYILFPDDVTPPDGFKPITTRENQTGSNADKYTNNEFTLEQFQTYLSQGAVFLPAAGNRLRRTYSLTETSGCGTDGYYWTASYYGGLYGTDTYEAKAFMFGSMGTETGSENRSYGYSVRLVADAN